MEISENKNIIKENNFEQSEGKIQPLEIMHKQENEKGEEEEDEYEDYEPRQKAIQTSKIKKFFSIFSRKTEKSVIIEEDLRKTGASINDTSETSKKKQKKRKNILEKIPLDILKLITVLIIIIYIIVAIVSIIVFFVQRNKKENPTPFLFCFTFMERKLYEEQYYEKYDTILFLADLNSFCIIHFILLILFIKLLYTFYNNQTRDIKNFFKDFSIYFDVTLLINIPIFFLGIISDYKGNDDWKIVFYIILTGIGTLSSFKIYLQTKYNRYKNLTRLINQGILSGVLASFELYCLMYNICAIVTWGTGTDIDDSMEIIPGSIYFVFCFFFIFFYKDIIFPITSLIVEIGLLYLKKENDLEVCIFNVSVVALNFSTIILTIFKYNKLVFVPLEAIQSNKKKYKHTKKKKK